MKKILPLISLIAIMLLPVFSYAQEEKPVREEYYNGVMRNHLHTIVAAVFTMQMNTIKTLDKK